MDIGGTNMRAALVDCRGTILHSAKTPTGRNEARDDILDRMVDLIDDCKVKSRTGIKAVGIGFPGPLNVREGYIYEPPNIPSLKKTPLKKILERRLNLPVFVENDANAAALAEYRFGAGKDAKSLVCLTLGTGVGGGLILDGKIWHGADDVAGEIGHMKIRRSGRLCGCGARGCLERYASATGVVLSAKTRLRKNAGSLILKLVKGDIGKVTAKIVTSAAKEGDETAIEILAETAGHLAFGVANILNVLNPRMVVICGGLARAGKFLFTPLKTEVKRLALESAFRNVRIVRGKLGDRAGLLGAAAVAFARLD